MELKFITCRSIGTYGKSVTKGDSYEVLNEKDDLYRINGDNGKRIWINKLYFVEGVVKIPILTSWKFDDDIIMYDFIDVTFTLSDGSKRWSIITTPEKLANHFKKENLDPPGLNIHHLIILRSLNIEDVDRTFKNLDQQDELMEASNALE